MVGAKGLGNAGFAVIWSSNLANFRILVKAISRESFCLKVSDSDLVFSLVKRLQEKMHILHEFFQLIHEGQQL